MDLKRKIKQKNSSLKKTLQRRRSCLNFQSRRSVVARPSGYNEIRNGVPQLPFLSLKISCISQVFHLFSDSQKIFNEGAIRYNLGVIDYCRTSMSALSGGAAGILGLTALQVGRRCVFLLLIPFNRPAINKSICMSRLLPRVSSSTSFPPSPSPSCCWSSKPA